mgnify:FL=1
MRTLIQRVQHASVTIDGQLKSKIGKGLLVLVGIEDRDTQEDIEWLCKKIANLRIFDDENGVMNRSVVETEGSDGGQPVYPARLHKEGKPPFLYPCLQTGHSHSNVRGFLRRDGLADRKGSADRHVRRRHESGTGERRSCHDLDRLTKQRMKRYGRNYA